MSDIRNAVSSEKWEGIIKNNFEEIPSDSARLGASERDYIFHNGEELPTPQFVYDDKMIAYRQSGYKDGKMACTIISALTALGNNTGVHPDSKMINQCIQEAKKAGYNPKTGWYVQKAVDFVKKWAEREYGMKLAYFRAYYSDFKYLASKGFQLCGGYNNFDGVSQDKWDDGILGNNIKYGNFKYGHAFNYCEIDGDFCGLDNYDNHTKYNIFKIQNVAELVKAGVLFKYAYFFVNLEEVRNDYSGLLLKDKIAKLKARKSYKKYESKQT